MMENKSEGYRDLSIDEIITISAEARVDLDELKKWYQSKKDSWYYM